MHTNGTVLTRYGVDTSSIEHLDVEVAILTGNQRQGDVFVLKVTADHTANATPIGPKGVTVVRAETNSANTHSLYALAGDPERAFRARRSRRATPVTPVQKPVTALFHPPSG